MSKYDPLTRHLKSARATRVPMAFDEIEAVLGFDLPKSARKHRPWWSNEADGTHVQARAWVSAGYQATEVDMAAERLMFVQLNAVDPHSPRTGDHPLWGAMAGTVVYIDDVDLTEPIYTDAELDGFIEDLDQLLREGRN